MTAQKRAPRRQAPAAAAAAGNEVLDLLADFGREQFALCLDASSATLRCVEAMRTIQQRSAQEASARHQAAARRWRDSSHPAELAALPWTVWQDDLASASRTWQELAAAALEAQTEVLGCACGHVFDSESALHGVAAMEALEAVPGMRALMDSGAAFARHALPR